MQHLKHLTPVDYGVVIVYIGICVAIGWRAGKRPQDGATNYFLAGQDANKFTVAVSLVSGLTSGISFLGIPGYAYDQGLTYLFVALGSSLSVPLLSYYLVPFYVREKSPSAYAFLETRFSRNLRSLAAGLFLVRMIFYMATVLFAPALAINAVTGVNMTLTIVICGTLATLYTLKGGMRAVIHTDFLQTLVLTGGAVATLAVVVRRLPGARLPAASLRLPGDFWGVPDLRSDNLWFLTLGALCYSLGQCGADQLAIQRYCTTASLHQAQFSALVGGLSGQAVGVVLVLVGVALQAFYERDPPGPLHSGAVATTDQVFPYFVVNETPAGIPGLVLAGLIGCTMSVFSAALNGCTTCTITDFVQNLGGADLSDTRRFMLLSRGATLVFGATTTAVSVALTFTGGSLVTISQTALGLTSGPIVGIFLMGMYMPQVDNTGALSGFWAACVVGLYILVGMGKCHLVGQGDGRSTYDRLGFELGSFLSYEKCDSPFWAFSTVNVFVYTPLLMVVTFVVAIVVSWGVRRRSKWRLRRAEVCPDGEYLRLGAPVSANATTDQMES